MKKKQLNTSTILAISVSFCSLCTTLGGCKSRLESKTLLQNSALDPDTSLLDMHQHNLERRQTSLIDQKNQVFSQKHELPVTYATIIDPDFAQTAPHLTPFIGSILLGNHQAQLIIPGVQLQSDKNDINPLIASSFYWDTKTGWNENVQALTVDFAFLNRDQLSVIKTFELNQQDSLAWIRLSYGSDKDSTPQTVDISLPKDQSFFRLFIHPQKSSQKKPSEWTTQIHLGDMSSLHTYYEKDPRHLELFSYTEGKGFVSLIPSQPTKLSFTSHDNSLIISPAQPQKQKGPAIFMLGVGPQSVSRLPYLFESMKICDLSAMLGTEANLDKQLKNFEQKWQACIDTIDEHFVKIFIDPSQDRTKASVSTGVLSIMRQEKPLFHYKLRPDTDTTIVIPPIANYDFQYDDPKMPKPLKQSHTAKIHTLKLSPKKALAITLTQSGVEGPTLLTHNLSALKHREKLLIKNWPVTISDVPLGFQATLLRGYQGAVCPLDISQENTKTLDCRMESPPSTSKNYWRLNFTEFYDNLTPDERKILYGTDIQVMPIQDKSEKSAVPHLSYATLNLPQAAMSLRAFPLTEEDLKSNPN